MDIFKRLRATDASLMKDQINYYETVAKDVMITPIFLYENDNISTIADKLKQEDTNYCIVIDKNKKFL